MTTPQLAEVLRALADETRLSILEYLARGAPICCPDIGICACDLVRHTGLSQGTVSHHMRLLAGANLVRAERRGKWVYYELNSAAFEQLQQELARFSPAVSGALTPFAEHDRPQQRLEVTR